MSTPGCGETRNVTICFRTSEELQSALRRIGGEERRSMSSVIEHVLLQYVQDKEQLRVPREEKRRHARKKISAPALIMPTNDDKQVQAGVVLDISLGGIQISMPNGYEWGIQEDKERSRISVVFTLPDRKKPVTVQCMPKRVLPSDDATMIGACFTDADFASYQALQDYLVN